MQPLNPFLRAFFRSGLPAQCNPIEHHVLLVPITDSLIHARDRETGSLYVDLTTSEDFLASHVLRIPGSQAVENGGPRDHRGRARQLSTINGRTVVVKESLVYSNKGFRNLNQAHLLTDLLYHTNSIDSQQWLMYYISKPMVGSLEAIKVPVAPLKRLTSEIRTRSRSEDSKSTSPSRSASSKTEKKEIKSFTELLNNFPLIARQMQNGLDGVVKEFRKQMDEWKPTGDSRPSPKSARRSSVASSHSTSNGSIHRLSSRLARSPSALTLHTDERETHMRQTLETAVTASIDLFQLVDKQQLSLVGSTTTLTGPMVERLIERHVTEQLHEPVLMPMLCTIRKEEDLELESCISHMGYLDISQVGIAIEDGREGRDRLLRRISQGVEEFRKLGMAGSPQQMIELLLETQKLVTGSGITPKNTDSSDQSEGLHISEKPKETTMNADTLVSLLLLVIIRSQVQHLQARLAYMTSFIFIDDIETGETGYALSTFEAVLSYLTLESSDLRRASKQNRRLWHATKRGDVPAIRAILEPDPKPLPIDAALDSHSDDEDDLAASQDQRATTAPWANGAPRGPSSSVTSKTLAPDEDASQTSTLAHVFPFQASETSDHELVPPRKVKRVSMDIQSISNFSEYSLKSQTTTIDSQISALEGDTSIETLANTQDAVGNSVPMMAIEAQQPTSLEYLLSLEQFYAPKVILDDSNSDGTTLLSAAVQLAHTGLIEIMMHFLFQIRDTRILSAYLRQADCRGRTVAHYLFNAPQVIPHFSEMLPWRQKDNNGQTPLLALCRSYDHPEYSDMLNIALKYAILEQDDNQPLHLDNHVDSKGNTLLHAINDPSLAVRILRHCDADPNAANDKRFTPLMVASKYGRIDMVRALFGDRRVDGMARELRGMTAVELAKDDEIRSRIDDMSLVSHVPGQDGRVTAVVRSFLWDDGSVRLIVKSAIRNRVGMITVTLCRRTLNDFEDLAKWLAVEHPASWLPSIFNFRSPFQIASKPSKAVLADIQVRLDKFLAIMLAHSTFSTHELLWEFVLLPEIQPDMMAERSRKKAETRSEKVKEEYEPVEDVKEVELFVGHAREAIRGINQSTRSVIRRLVNTRNAQSDFAEALDLCLKPFSTLDFLPNAYLTAFSKYVQYTQVTESDPFKFAHQDFQAIYSTILAMLSSLSRPHSLISSMQNIQKAIDRHQSSLRRSDRWPLGLLDDTRKSLHAEAEAKASRSKEELRGVACELRYTQQTVAGELAGWQELHAKLGRRAIKALAEKVVTREKDRLEGMKRALRCITESKRR